MASVAAYEKKLLTAALGRAAFNRTVAASRLGLGYHQLRRLLKKHGIAEPSREAG